MATNDFQPFAAQVGANVISQATYLTLAALGPGFSSGIAYSNQLNKVWRQSSIMAAVLGSLITTVVGLNATDDGTTATLAASLAQVINQQDFQIDTSSSANVYTVAQIPAPAIIDGFKIRVRALHTNTGASTLTVNGTTNSIFDRNGVPITAGSIIMDGSHWFEYNVAIGGWILMDAAGPGINGHYQPAVVASALLTWTTTAGSAYSFAHGKGSVPDIVRATFVNQTAEAGYSPGDVIEAYSVYTNPGSVGTTVWANATTIGLALFAGDNNVVIKGGTTASAITPANWKIQLSGVWLH